MRKFVRPRLWFALTAVLVVVVLGGNALVPTPVAVASVARATTTTVAITPSQVSLNCGATKLVEIRINDVTNLFGVDVKVSYDPKVLEVIDADATMPGTQITAGDFPNTSSGQGLIQTNSVDTATGTISYVAVRLSPAPPQTGSGVIASVNFKAKAAGTSQVNLVSAMLSDQTAKAIPADLVNGKITVTCTGPTPTPSTWPGQPTPTPSTWPGKPTPTPPPGTTCTYVVRPGDTLYSIARRYGTTVADLQAANHISDPNLIYVGQTLIIPNCNSGPVPPPPGKCFTYTVKLGDTLSGIALANCDTVYGISTRNGLVNPNLIYAGQNLTVCSNCGGGPTPPPNCKATYTVMPGDTLYGIALKYGVTVYTLAAANNISNPNLIYVGQVLCIP
jgi:LysM repeat protein